MHWVRTGAALGLIGAGSSAWALGLGDIELDSALNEKLDARIELLNAQGLQPTEVIVSLASQDDFERIGVERFFFLSDLRFEVDFGDGGVRHIQVTSTQPVTEPYLNFLVEVLWPSGRMLKEYTLLLDPPTLSPAPAPSVAAPAQARDQSSGAGRVEREPATTASQGTRVQLAPGRQQQPSPLDEGVVDGEYRMTDRNDTLWTIASRTLPSNAVTVQQNMLAIQRLNADAFLNGNINLLKAGYTLRLPTESEALSLSNADAGSQVAMQNEDWRALKRGETPPSRGEQQVASSGDTSSAMRGQVDATPAQAATSAPRDASDGELRIVAGAGDNATGTTDPATAASLDAVREEQDRLTREVSQLNEALDREKEIATNQIAVKDRQLEVKDQQIAEMQAEIERLRQDMEQAQAAAAQSQNQSASGADPWWQSPYVLGGAAGVVVLALVYGLVAARRRRAAEDDFYPEVADAGAFDAAVAARRTRVVAAAAPEGMEDLDEDLDSDLDESPALAEEGRPAAAAAASGQDAETGDVIGEADIYIAYGRYPQAISLLLGVLEEDQNRNDVRLKLLELYAETRDREGFDTHMAELLERCDDDDALLTARELSQQFGGADTDAAPAPGTVDIGANLADDDSTALSLEERNGDDSAPLTGAEASSDGAADDFELELDDVEVRDPAGGSAGDALGGDLGIDFDPDRDRSDLPESADALTSTDDLDLDLDLDDEALADEAFDFEDEGDTASTKLDLARAYIDMGDQDGARDILNEVVSEGSAEQQQRAQAMLEEL